MCGSDCGLDSASSNWETERTGPGQPSTVAGIWVSLNFLEPLLVSVVADVCWETTNPCAPWKLNNKEDPNEPFHYDPDDFPGVEPVVAYTPTCYDNRIETALPVTSGLLTSVTLDVEMASLQGVRCMSPSLTIGISHKECTELSYQMAFDYCENYVDENGVDDYRLPDTPLEAGRLCGSGCGYDITSASWENDPISVEGTVASIAGVWVGLRTVFNLTTNAPTMSPTRAPTVTTASPTTRAPTSSPTVPPTMPPTDSPTTSSPTFSPTTQTPTLKGPTASPTTRAPTSSPTIPPTMSPTVSPTTSSPTSSPTTFSPTGSPTASPTEGVATIIVSEVTFPNLEISALDDPVANATFQEEYILQVSTAASVDASSVTINSINPGSVVVSSTTLFPTEATAASFNDKIGTDPAAIFDKLSFSTYGAPTATATAAVYVAPSPPPAAVVTITTSATVSPTADSAENAAPAVLVGWTSLAALSFLVALFF